MQKRVSVVVIVPTYELAAQVFSVARELWNLAGLLGREPALLVGGAGIERQISALKEKPRVVIGSPGRIAELIRLKKLTGHFVRTVVLDECDKLLGKDSLPHVKEILKTTPKDRQVLLFSATARGRAEQLEGFINEPVIINAGGHSTLPGGTSHHAITCDRRDKIPALRAYINREGVASAILFVRNASDAENAAKRLAFHGIKAAHLSADMAGPGRKTAIGRLQSGETQVLAATDGAARGLDIAGLTHVFNFEPPLNKDEYLHRAGRVGRMGAVGTVVTLVSGNERERLQGIGRALGIDIKGDRL